MKWLSLIILFFQNGATPLIFRYATTEADQDNRFSTSMAVLCAEALKMVVSALFIFFEEKSFSRGLQVLKREVMGKPIDTLKLAVPAILYFIQNNCLQLASSNLPAAVYQVTYQGKTLVVAFCSVLLLSKMLTRVRWLALTLLAAGLAVVQLSKNTETAQSTMGNAEEQSIAIGLFFVLIGCFCSGFAGVYFERMMKGPSNASKTNQKKPSMWVRNVQLAGFSVLIGLSVVVVSGGTNGDHPVFQGFTTPVWIMVFNNALGGLCVALVIKHADNILKGFACALATILTCFVSMPLFGFQLSFGFAAGMLVVIGSTLLYGGTVKLPGDWWNSEPSVCRSFRSPARAAKTPKSYDPEKVLLMDDQLEDGRLLSRKNSSAV